MALPGSTILENAHKYRMHQDVLRWTLLGGYAAFLGTTLALLSSSSMRENWDLQRAASLVLFGIGTCYLFVLAVENWFYNVFAKHASHCEEAMRLDETPMTIAEFFRTSASTVTPFHSSFFFSLLVLALGNCAYLYIGVRNFFDHPLKAKDVDWYLTGAMLTFTVIYFLFFYLLFKAWDRIVYKRLIIRLQNFFSPAT